MLKGKSTKARSVRKALKKLREKERKQDIIYRTAKIIEEVARRNNAIVVIGNVNRGKKKLVENVRKNTLRHRISQWNVVRLVEVLRNKPLHAVEISEAYTSSINPFYGKRIRKYTPSMIHHVVRGSKRIKGKQSSAKTS
ncbi:MAG: IS200/IS605 family accessory protein TnpB-related protein [Caldisphaeraceae archaeon]|nr:IS200/IS605 family accessory protein TnpB-related protein [Caldisphaeraceae archaeon]